jgi:hypothetical protein
MSPAFVAPCGRAGRLVLPTLGDGYQGVTACAWLCRCSATSRVALGLDPSSYRFPFAVSDTPSGGRVTLPSSRVADARGAPTHEGERDRQSGEANWGAPPSEAYA